MSTPKPPSQISVAATLRAADFKRARKIRQGADLVHFPGFEVGPTVDGVRVDYSLGSHGFAESSEDRREKLEQFADLFRSKGWAVLIAWHAEPPYVAVYAA